MKKISNRELLEQLEAGTRQVILVVNYLLQEDPGALQQQPQPGKWSVAQVIEHLNSYGRYYLPKIESALESSRYPVNNSFTPGWLGNYFTKIMSPKNGEVTNKMTAPKNHRPSPAIDSKKALDEFLEQEKLLLRLLEMAKHTDIGKLRIPISIVKFIKLKLGDTFRFVIAHHQRHFIQVTNTLALVKNARPVLQEYVQQSIR